VIKDLARSKTQVKIAQEIYRMKPYPLGHLFLRGLRVQMDEDLMGGLDKDTASPAGTSTPPTSAKCDAKSLTFEVDLRTAYLHKSNRVELELNLKAY